MIELAPETSHSNMANTYQADLFKPSAEDTKIYGAYRLHEPSLFVKPDDVLENHLAYNPSSIWTVKGKEGVENDIMYVRVEPNRSSPESSHLGKAVIRPYIVNPRDPKAPLRPYYDADEILGEDPALTRINRRLKTGKLEEIWLLSCVDAKPMPDKQNAVNTLCTRFYAGTNLKKLEHVADGPEWMKDIRITRAHGPLGTELGQYGRPQTQSNSGNITYATIKSIEKLSSETIASAPYINTNLLPIGSGVWGGVNDVARVSHVHNILKAHRAWRTGPDGRGRHYESVLYGHNTLTNRIVELGVIATADMFHGNVVKDDSAVDLSDVVFTGGGYNGGLEFMTFGVSDGSIGIGGLRRLQKPLV